MEAPQPGLDETIWTAPEFLANSFWGKLTGNSVYPYFSWSPFFDLTSNNNTINTQAGSSQVLWDAYHNRHLYEARLRSMQGLEFMVIEDPSDNGARPDDPGVWVIRKQLRKKREGLEDEITPITCYIIMGDAIIMAPSVADILGSRLISTMTSLNKYINTASTLPLFTPAVGHTWYPPQAKPLAAAIGGRPGQASKDGTPLPGSPASSVDGNKPPLVSKTSIGADYQELKLLSESYHMSLMYGHEYMDENPLVGEPGSFRINKTKEVAPKPVLNIETPFSAPAANGKSPECPVIPKKNKGGEKSPITPGTKEKKSRRKSKAAGANVTMTPK